MPTPTIRRAVFFLLTAVLAAGPVSAVDTMAQSSAPSGSGQPQAAAERPSLPLTMRQAVDMALEFNLGLKADKMSPAIQDEAVAAARAYYNPALLANGSIFRADSAPTSFLDSSATSVTNKRNNFSAGVGQQLRWFGGNYQIGFGGGRNENTQAGNPFNPQLGSSFSVTFNQPLLRNLKTDSARTTLKNSRVQRQISDTALLDSIARTERDSRLLYLNLVGAIEGRKVAQQNLDISRESLRGNRARVEVGMMAPADIVDAEAAVSDREEALIIADGQIESAMDQLRKMILDPGRADYWTVQLVPTDTIEAAPRAVDAEAAVKTALENRSDLIIARKNLEITRSTVDLLHNQTLPNVDFHANYTGSGTAGTQLTYANGDYTTPATSSSKGFGSAIGDAFRNVQPAWTYSVQVAYPIGHSDTKANYTRAQLQTRQSEIQLHDAELAVATQVRDAARSVQTSFKRVQAARASLAAQAKRLEAEQKRFDVGLSQTFTLFTVQGDMARARVNELQARLAYTQALINFDAVQKIR